MDKTSNLHYRIYIETKEIYKAEIINSLTTIEKEVERLLCNNPYYKTAINLQQLTPIKAHLLEEDFKSKLFDFYAKNFKVKDGDLKMPILFKKDSLNSLLHL